MLPDQSPVTAIPAYCHRCGTLMKVKVVMGPRGIDHVEQTCTNQKTGCSYVVETKQYLQCEMRAIRPDGSVVR